MRVQQIAALKVTDQCKSITETFENVFRIKYLSLQRISF